MTEKMEVTNCAYCGGVISPGDQVGVLPTAPGEPVQVCHTRYDCSPPGNTRYGVWGEGELRSSFMGIEQC